VKLLAQGRASAIYALDDERVLRRFKAGGNPEREARVMKRALDHGYPVPRVYEVREHEMVIERIHGPSMYEDLIREPERADVHAETLAGLHDQLHRIPGESSGTILHLDLHPANVLMPSSGPVVIDWANAREGPPDVDAALTWVICMTSAGEIGRRFGEAFARRIDVRSGLEQAAAFRMRDRNVSDEERQAVERLLS
jgi:aminoglycoside phosphotransferase (APT) family kinase protein